MTKRTNVFGKLMQQQCEEKLESFDTGKKVSDNIKTMKTAIKMFEGILS